jgi:hypothetical protein
MAATPSRTGPENTLLRPITARGSARTVGSPIASPISIMRSSERFTGGEVAASPFCSRPREMSMCVRSSSSGSPMVSTAGSTCSSCSNASSGARKL